MTIEQLFTDMFSSGRMCKGCYVKALACPDLNYKCPIHDVPNIIIFKGKK